MLLTLNYHYHQTLTPSTDCVVIEEGLRQHRLLVAVYQRHLARRELGLVDQGSVYCF
jgi:hypothetical protein